MRAHRLSIILLLSALSFAPAARTDDGAGPTTVARQNYAYDPKTKTVTLDLKTVYSGCDAELFRVFYARTDARAYSKAKLDYYRTMYDSVAEATPPTVKDDHGRNVIETAERYTVGLAGLEDDEQLHRFPIYPDLLRGFYSSLPASVHRPYPLNQASDRRNIVTVDAPTLGLYAVRDGDVSSTYFAFTRKASARADHVEMDYRLRFLADSVPVADFERYRSDVERMDHNIYAWIDLDRDFYHRYYRKIPKMIRSAAGIGLAATAIVLWWFVRRRRRAD